MATEQAAADQQGQEAVLTRFFDNYGRFVEIDPEQQFAMRETVNGEWNPIASYALGFVDGYPAVIIENRHVETGNSIRLENGQIFNDSPFSVFTESGLKTYITARKRMDYNYWEVDSSDDDETAETEAEDKPIVEDRILVKLQKWKETLSPEITEKAKAEADRVQAPYKKLANEKQAFHEEMQKPFHIIQTSDGKTLVAFPSPNNPISVSVTRQDGVAQTAYASCHLMNQTALRQNILAQAMEGNDTSFMQDVLKTLEKVAEQHGTLEAMNERFLFGFIFGRPTTGQIMFQENIPTEQAVKRFNDYAAQREAALKARESASQQEQQTQTEPSETTVTEDPIAQWEDEGGAPEDDGLSAEYKQAATPTPADQQAPQQPKMRARLSDDWGGRWEGEGGPERPPKNTTPGLG